LTRFLGGCTTPSSIVKAVTGKAMRPGGVDVPASVSEPVLLRAGLETRVMVLVVLFRAKSFRVLSTHLFCGKSNAGSSVSGMCRGLSSPQSA